ncbi:protein-disulfide reductase DsbD family protein [Mariniblastus fucicola]|uniref:Thiol:disulfide interchange protein DsbD n=1 Tax=Mariniblastus fucicola TaxID=980251 RepID=A0A5B9PBJ4_9BACT|nr:cytochrome c biogenesis protein CcdA [Mariniblastus fucicola]QEG22819.1 Thiol:disulfide interchange protein DsbD precursor [Mariniblastus fucicola]
MMVALAACLLVGVSAGTTVAQFGTPAFGADGDPFTLTAKFGSFKDSNKGILTVTATIEKPWHIYSLTQPEGGPTRSEIIIEDSEKFKITGDFEPDSDPHSEVEEAFAPVPSEYHEGTVKWSAPIQLAEGVDPQELAIEVSYAGLRCAGMEGCVPIGGVEAVANFGGFIEAINSDAPLRIEDSHLLISGKLAHEGGGKLKPGDKAFVEVKLEPVDGFHVYQYTPDPEKPESVEKLTLLAVTKANDWSIDAVEVIPEDPATVKTKKGVKHYEGPVTLKIPFTIGAEAEAKEYVLGGVAGFQTCDPRGCTQPRGVSWEVTVPVAVESTASPNLRVTDTGVQYSEVEEKVKDAAEKNKNNAGAWSGYSPMVVLPLAFVAGFILNFMPCVLPVVGLKIMSFMHMAGENPRRVFMLNFVFVLGMLAVFMVFAALAVTFNFGWGEAYTNLSFKVIMIAIVFGFGLSFFGLWEIPMPGVVNSEKANELANQEGYVGQFFKGILTTLLATPCSGPMLIPAVVWAMAQTPLMTFTVFLFLGLGMALPYLVIGAFPKLAGFLPKPGGWMETFKQIMGFVLIATTIFLINGVSAKYNTSVLTMLLFIGLGCWWIGKTELYEPLGKQLKAWGAGFAIIAFGVFLAFGALLPWYELDYKPYSDAAVAKHLKEGRTVLVDFTADW